MAKKISKVKPVTGAELTKAKKAGFKGTPPKKPAVKDQTIQSLTSYKKKVNDYNKKVKAAAKKYDKLQALKKSC